MTMRVVVRMIVRRVVMMVVGQVGMGVGQELLVPRCVFVVMVMVVFESPGQGPEPEPQPQREENADRRSHRVLERRSRPRCGGRRFHPWGGRFLLFRHADYRLPSFLAPSARFLASLGSSTRRLNSSQ